MDEYRILDPSSDDPNKAFKKLKKVTEHFLDLEVLDLRG